MVLLRQACLRAPYCPAVVNAPPVLASMPLTLARYRGLDWTRSIAGGKTPVRACAAALAAVWCLTHGRLGRGRGVHGRKHGTLARAAAAANASTSTGSSPEKPRVLFIIGGPGSGKGTMCERIAQRFGYVHLSAGELLRAEREQVDSPLGSVIESAIVAGKTVPSEVIAGLLEQAMRGAGWADACFVIDGYPRSEEQLCGWEATLSHKVQLLSCLSLEVSREEMRRRILHRAKTSGRLDDNEDTVEKRFATFVAETGPLLEHFESAGLLAKVDGEGGIDEVWQDVQAVVEAVGEANGS